MRLTHTQKKRKKKTFKHSLHSVQLVDLYRYRHSSLSTSTKIKSAKNENQVFCVSPGCPTKVHAPSAGHWPEEWDLLRHF